jgi:hypothetical protein
VTIRSRNGLSKEEEKEDKMREDLGDKSREDHVYWVYEEHTRPWSVIMYGIALSAWRGMEWILCRGRR